MQPIARSLRIASLVVLGLSATPLVAQQTTQTGTPPRRPAQVAQQPAAAPQRTAQRAPAPAQQSQAGSGAANRQAAGQYPVRRAGATEPLPQAGTGGQPQAGVPAQVQPIAPVAPFALTPTQEQLLKQILLNWEKQSESVKTFKCTFGRWEINPVFGPPEHHYVLSEAFGEIKFKEPDKGVYKITRQSEWDPAKKAYTATEHLDHWVCDGNSIYEFNQQQKQLIQRELAPEMRGKAITDGPLPFVFGTKADQLQARYWMRDITPAEDVGKYIHLEAWPKQQRDAANFQHAIIMLNQKDFMPAALRIVLPDGKNKQDYKFENISKNNPLAVLDFMAPRKPLTWTHVVIPAGGEQEPGPNAGVPAQAQQQPPVTR